MKKYTNTIYVIVILVLTAIISLYLTSYAHTNVNKILATIVNLIGIILGGTITTLAIIMGLLSIQELYIISKIYEENENKNKYLQFIQNVRTDVNCVLFCLILSLVSLLISYSKIQWWLLWIGFASITLTLSAIHDLINSLFLLIKVKYEISKLSKKWNKS